MNIPIGVSSLSSVRSSWSSWLIINFKELFACLWTVNHDASHKSFKWGVNSLNIFQEYLFHNSLRWKHRDFYFLLNSPTVIWLSLFLTHTHVEYTADRNLPTLWRFLNSSSHRFVNYTEIGELVLNSCIRRLWPHEQPLQTWIMTGKI